ncbi:hypothetical protein OG474_36380 [Kribbella sp. NBC_01505]|uniref:hypothetical protein n=1 Tax=Kribbella sp. NBC_01505 TaxID=2903580 RepID=UPI0038647425
MTTATLDDFDLDIQLGVLDPHRIATPEMLTTRSNPHSEPCCTDWNCPTDVCPS